MLSKKKRLLSPIEAKIGLLAELIIRGLEDAPHDSSSLCFAALPVAIIEFDRLVNETPRFISSIRLKYPHVLDAYVTFANSAWSTNQIAALNHPPKPCTCNCRDRVIGALHKSTVMTLSNRQPRPTLYAVTHLVFRTLTLVVESITSGSTHGSKLEKAGGEGKWPSSASIFLPYGADIALDAFLDWAEATDIGTPIRFLGAVVSICPSLEASLMKSKRIFPLFERMSRERADVLRGATKSTGIHGMFGEDHGEDFMSFYHFVCGKWFQEHAPLKNSAIPNPPPMVSLYHSSCHFLVWMQDTKPDNLVTILSKDSMLTQLMLTTFLMYSYIIHTTCTEPPKLHSAVKKFIEENNLITQESMTTSVLIGGLNSVRHQTHCTNLACQLTCESTKSNFKMCSGCQVVRYCSRSCQSAAWSGHKNACRIMCKIAPICKAHAKARTKEEEANMLKDVMATGVSLEEISALIAYLLPHSRFSDENLTTERIQGISAPVERMVVDTILQLDLD